MGVVIPLFKTKVPETAFVLDEEEKLRVKIIQSSLEALKREEKVVEALISEKCREEIDRLNLIDQKMRQLEEELEDLVGVPNNNKPNTADWLS
jgi:hypothetical protein